MCWRFMGIWWTWFGLSYSPSFTLPAANQQITRMNYNAEQTAANVIQVPASTGWPLVAAFGLTLVFAGLLTHVMVSTLGAITLCLGLVGWFRQVLPHDVHESVALEKEELVLPVPSRKVLHLQIC